LLRIAFWVLLANFLPTLNFLAPQTPMRFATANTLLRVLPVAVSFVSLLLYCIGNGWAALREGAEGLALPRGQVPQLIGTGAVLTISGGAVLASLFFSVPERLAIPLPQWSADDWSTHCEDLLARPHLGLKPADLAGMHYLLGTCCVDTNPRLSLEHYDAAIELVSGEPDRLFKLGDRLLRSRQIELAMAAYRRVLKADPQHPLAQKRLRQLEDLPRPESR
jgi:tetratricopeptide (TPR) repeat protein